MRKSDKRFANFVENVAKHDIKSVKEHILSLCKVSLSCYYKWILGTATPSLERRMIINAIAFKFQYPIVYEHAKGYKHNNKIFKYGSEQNLEVLRQS